MKISSAIILLVLSIASLAQAESCDVIATVTKAAQCQPKRDCKLNIKVKCVQNSYDCPFNKGNILPVTFQPAKTIKLKKGSKVNFEYSVGMCEETGCDTGVWVYTGAEKKCPPSQTPAFDCTTD